MKKIISLLFIVLSTQIFAQFGSQDSGGKLSPFQACYDVKFYDLNLTIDLNEKAIAGTVIMRAQALSDFKKILIDLDSRYTIDGVQSVLDNKQEIDLKFTHESNKVWIDFPATIKKGEFFSTKITYAGLPRIAKRPPWDDGLVLAKTKDGKDWVTLTCQGGGADTWWPCKDHPSDEPDSVSLHFTAPSDLILVSNGRFISSNENNNGTKTWNWFVSTPINNYGVIFYLGPYKRIDYDYTSVTGEKFPFTVWVLPESYEKAKEHAPQFLIHMKVMEELIGPYPFRGDKYAVVEAPHLGMEQQTAIAYGYGWKNHPQFAFDWLHHHEFSHEWWGNLVTCRDWSDFWIHEGIGTYMQPLYLEKVFGKDEYFRYMKSIKHFSNKNPVAQRGEKTSSESYNNDIYYKGGWIVHTLRYYLGDEMFFKVLRRWAYPTEEMEKIKDGRQCRITTTDELMEMAEKISGKKLDWFFEVYLRHAPLPILNVKSTNNKVELSWETENNLPFPMPVDVSIAGKIVRMEMKNGISVIDLPQGSDFTVDPMDWVLKAVKQ
ncbi:MAG: M1 family metallopeptidase [Ignavibacteriales bacterium]|nr:M1 family metallopeptidase [Ignavibacteriales bacterium]